LIIYLHISFYKVHGPFHCYHWINLNPSDQAMEVCYLKHWSQLPNKAYSILERKEKFLPLMLKMQI